MTFLDPSPRTPSASVTLCASAAAEANQTSGHDRPARSSDRTARSATPGGAGAIGVPEVCFAAVRGTGCATPPLDAP